MKPTGDFFDLLKKSHFVLELSGVTQIVFSHPPSIFLHSLLSAGIIGVSDHPQLRTIFKLIAL